MYDALIINDRHLNQSYFALMHNDHLNSVEKKRKALRVWIRDVMHAQNMSANEWAVKAGTSPTNITRFLKDSKYMPSSKTLAKLSAVCGSDPYVNVDAPGQTRTLEVLDIDGNRLKYVNVYDVQGKVLAYYIKGRSGYGHGGIHTGDTVLVRQDIKIKDNHVVLIKCNAYIDEDANFVFDKEAPQRLMCGQVMGKYIIFKSVNAPNNILVADVEVIGVVIQCIKNFEV